MTTIRLFIFAVAFGAAACTGDPTGEDASRLVGRYTLSAIDGKPLPGIVREDANRRWEYHAGTLRLNSDLTFIDSTTVSLTRLFLGEPIPDLPVLRYVDAVWGLYSLPGDTIYMHSLRNERYTMLVHSSGALMRDQAGVAIAYRR